MPFSAPSDIIISIEDETRATYHEGLQDHKLPNERCGQFVKQTFGTFKCDKCRKVWSSGKVTVELDFMKKGKGGGSGLALAQRPGLTGTQFDITLYGQQCSRCPKLRRGKVIDCAPQLSADEWAVVVDKFVDILTSEHGRREQREGRDADLIVQSKPHKEELCEKCRTLGSQCWVR